MNLNKYTFNGFKLYLRRETYVTMRNEENDNYFNILVQYKEGVASKVWSQEIIKGVDGEEWDRWTRAEYMELRQDDEFVRNMPDEEVFGILL